MEPVDDEEILLFGELAFLFLLSADLGQGETEPLLEVIAAGEDLGQQEVEQTPQLGEVVLQRRAGQQQALLALVLHPQSPRELRIRVLHAVALVHHDVLPLVLVQDVLVLYDVLVSRQAHVPLRVTQLMRQHFS